MIYRVVPLAGQDRTAFSSGSDALDRYFRDRASQDVRRRVASCFLALDQHDAIAGFYTLAATSLILDRLPPEHAKRLPRYPVVPAVLLGRLAVAQSHQGKRLGGALVVDALNRARGSEAMAYAMLVDAKDDGAARFYQHLGFAPLQDAGLRLIRAL